MDEKKSILHELYVFSEWKPEPEYIQKSDNILPDNISTLWCWLNFFGSKKSLLDSVTAHKERQHKWHLALGDQGKVIAVLADNILEIRTKRTEYATITARTTVNRDHYAQWRKLVWSPDCTFVVLAYGNGMVSFYDLTASNLFNIPPDCSRPGGRECTNNTHAVASIIFMPLRVKDNKWNWEVVVITYDGRLRGYLVSHTERFKLHHEARLAGPGGGVSAATYCQSQNILYVAGVPNTACKDSTSPLRAGLTAWRILNDDPFYKLSVVSDQHEADLVKQGFQFYIPFFSSKNMAFVVRMELSPDSSKLVCLHCNGEVSVWRLPVLKLVYRWPLASQPQRDLNNPLTNQRPGKKDPMIYHVADVNWWSNQELILSRFSGAVSVCDIEDMVNILGKKPEFFQGTPQVSVALDGAFMALECETSVLPARRARQDDSTEIVPVEEPSDSFTSVMVEVAKAAMFLLTDLDRFQPAPRRVTVVSRVYRLLSVKSTTPDELFARKIETGKYKEALALAEAFNLDSDLVYQQQWRKNPVSTDAIEKYLSKVSLKIWAVHQCVDRLPETLPAANDLLEFGLKLTNERILYEINKDRIENEIEDPDEIALEDLNAYTSELLRCRHVMLFYKDRLRLYEAILRCEKSTYVKDEYDRLRSNSIVHSSMEIAKEGRVEALTCLWPNIKTVTMQLAVLEKLPETINPLDYQHLLPTIHPVQWFEKKSPIKIKPSENENDWCRKHIFRSIWSSNWSEDTSPDEEANPPANSEYAKWYDRRAREIEEHSGLVSHALTLVTIASVGGGVKGMDNILFHLLTLDTLIYDINVEGVTLKELQKMSILETCTLLMKMSTPATFVSDLKQFVIPFLKRVEKLSSRSDACLTGLTDYLESRSREDLSSILLVLQSPSSFELDVRTHLELAERCLFAYQGIDQLDKACDLLDTILKESDGSISNSELVRRVKSMEALVAGASCAAWRGVPVPPVALRDTQQNPAAARQLLTRVARSLAFGDTKPTQQDWEKLLADILKLQSSLFPCVTIDQCYEIYASALLTSGDQASIRLASEVLTCTRAEERDPPLVGFNRSAELVCTAAREYFNSASTLVDPSLEHARCCLQLIKEDDHEIQQELDLLMALQILNSYNVVILPIQVRLSSDKMSMIEQCIVSQPTAYLSAHKMITLAKALRIEGDDDLAREGTVLEMIGEYALSAGQHGAGSSAYAAAYTAAARLAALRYWPAAGFMARVAGAGHATGAPAAARRDLLAAAAALCGVKELDDVLRARLHLELEELHQMGLALKQHSLSDVALDCSFDDEFADAITTPVIENKDIVEPEKAPLLKYLLDTFQSKPAVIADKPPPDTEAVRCQEFYRSIYPDIEASTAHYGYDRFAGCGQPEPRAQAALKWYYIQNCDGSGDHNLEPLVVQQCAEELLYKDTALSVACLLHAVGGGSTPPGASTPSRTSTTSGSSGSSGHGGLRAPTAAAAALYATLIKCNAPELRDNVYLTTPSKMARTTLAQKNASSYQMDLIQHCIERLTAAGEVEKLRGLGFNVNGLMFHGDEDYRTETIYRVARSANLQHLSYACSLAAKYADPVEAWLAHARENTLAALTPATIPKGKRVFERIRDGLWPSFSGTQHNELINYFSLLKSLDETAVLHGLTAAEHIKLLKKAKAASADLDYKLIVSSPSRSTLHAHVSSIMRPETAALLVKFLRTAPSALRLPTAAGAALYTQWLTKHYFSTPVGSASKKWMQQYRQCASYFNKLGKEDLLEFVGNTCFTPEALERVPAATRNLMIMQAVDYCQQEQENEIKVKQNEQTWAQVGQELSRWARFLENFHSDTVQGIIEASGLPRDEMWPDLEMSHGDPNRVVPTAGRLVSAGLRPTALTALLQCLGIDAAVTTHRVFEHIVDDRLDDYGAVDTLVTRLTLYHKEGIKFSEELVDKVMAKAALHKLSPHKQISLLSLSQRERMEDSGDVEKIARFTIDLWKSDWPELDFEEITVDTLTTAAGRRALLPRLMALAAAPARRRALADALACWPHDRDGDTKSLHYEYLVNLLSSPIDRKESLYLIKLLLRRPVLSDEEVRLLASSVTGEGAVDAMWVTLLNDCDNPQEEILNLLAQHKESIQKQEIEDVLIKELLDKGMFLKLVPTVLYTSIINYIVNNSSAESPNEYTVKWAAGELVQANYVAEAGHLHLLTIGVPTSLRGFSQSVLYVKNMFNKN